MSFGKGSSGGGGLPRDAPFIGNPITRWKTDTGFYPSNALSWWVFKRPVALSNEDAPRGYLEVFDTDIRYQLTMGNTPAPKGHYILEAFNQDRAEVSGIAGIPLVTTGDEKPSVIAFFAGRVFYAGVHFVKFGTNVYFSQIVERIGQVGECFQTQDPTDEDVPDLLPSDGGVIVIPELGEVVRLFPKGDSLFVFAVNGVWQITGSEGVGFKANDFSVAKITNTPALSALSFVDVDGNPVWWNRSGIWTLASGKDAVSTPQVTSLTDTTIKRFYDDIPDESKKWAKGAYNHQRKVIQWVYKNEAPVDETERFKYDRILNLNIMSGAFYPWSVPHHVTDDNDVVDLRGVFSVEGDATVEIDENVTVNGAQVTVNAADVVITFVRREAADSVFKYTATIDTSP